jgi:hypothetical protein
VSFVVQPSFENARGRGDFRLRDAYVDLRLTEPAGANSVTLRFGQEKRPFGRYELTSSNNLVTIERGAGTGLLPVMHNNLFEAHGFIAHDMGLSVHARLGALAAHAGVYNGAGETTRDINDSKSYGARVTVAASPKLSLGASFFSHEDIVRRDPAPADSAFRNDAFGLDAQWGRPGDPGVYALAEFGRGEAVSAAKPVMRALTTVAAVNLRTGGRAVTAIEPVLRFDWSDPNDDTDDDAAMLLGAGVGLYFTPRAHLRVMIEHQRLDEALAQGESRTLTGVRSQFAVHF